MKRLLCCFLLSIALPPTCARAYVDHLSSFTLGRVIREAPRIEAVRLEKVDRNAGVMLFRKVSDLKGESSGPQIQQMLGEGLQPNVRRLILEWAEPGKGAVCFHNGK